jgi:hypothetical protein
LARNGLTAVGGHTHNHTILTVLTDESAEWEILHNKNRLELLIQDRCEFFAYPNGGENDFGRKHQEILKKLKFIAGFSLTQRRSNILSEPMAISRIDVAPEDTVSSFALRCSGASAIINIFKRKLRESAKSASLNSN